MDGGRDRQYGGLIPFSIKITRLPCEKASMGKMAGAMAVNYGALGGANFMAY
jgi:hypothetical protein